MKSILINIRTPAAGLKVALDEILIRCTVHVTIGN